MGKLVQVAYADFKKSPDQYIDSVTKHRQSIVLTDNVGTPRFIIEPWGLYAASVIQESLLKILPKRSPKRNKSRLSRRKA